MKTHPILAIDAFWAIEPKFGESALAAFDAIANAQLIGEPVAARGDQGGNGKLFQLLNGVAVISVAGPLTKAWTCAAWMFGGTPTADIRRQVRAAMRDDDVKSVLLLVDSPGGAVSGTADLANDVAELAKVKPVTAYIEDMGCSAAYWIASAASRIVCNATAVVGSIGVYSVVYDYSISAAMQGIKTHLIATGKHKGAGTPGTEVTGEQLAAMQANVDTFSAHFYDAIASGRKMSRERVDELATGEVWIGQQAVDAGLVDSVEPLDATLSDLQRRGNLSSRDRAEAASDIPKEEHMSDTKTKIGLFAGLMTALGITKAELPDEGGANADTDKHTETLIGSGTATIGTVTDPRVDAAIQGAARVLANAEVKALSADLIAQGRLTSAEREVFEAGYMACLEQDGGGALALSETGALVTGKATEGFVAVAKKRPAHTLFREAVAAGQLDEVQETQADKQFRKSYEKTHGGTK